ncbi:MAG: O-antigen ligase family protein [Chthoniobacterales bacterium]
MFARLGLGLITAGRTGLLLAVVMASVAYGLTRDSTIEFFNYWIGASFIAWFLGHILRRRFPAIPVLAWILGILILLFGWTSAALGWLDVWLIDNLENYPLWWDSVTIYGANYSDLAFPAMVRATALLGATALAIDLFSDVRWTRALLITWGATATGMVVFFFLQRTFGEPFLLRSSLDPRRVLTFATFRYWGNAASYLNLSWPLLVGLATYSIKCHRAKGWTFWLSCALIAFSAVFLNVSKAGNILGIVGLLLFVSLLSFHTLKHWDRRRVRFSYRTAILVVIPVIVIAVSLAAALPTDRWERLLNRDVDKDPRRIAYSYFLTMLPESGWMGFGPGNYKQVYWDYVGDDPTMARTPFWVAHQDYLQTVIEWGYLGTITWALVFAFPIFALARQSFFTAPSRLDQRQDYAYSLSVHARLFWEAIPDARAPLLAIAGLIAITLTALHSLVDFPMQIASLQFYFLLWIALGWKLWLSPGDPATPKSRRQGAEPNPGR